MKKKISIALLLMTAFFCWNGCNVERFPITPFLALQDFVVSIGDTTYLELYPPFQLGFNRPSSIIIGKDQLFYVADTKNDRVVMMDIAGGYIGECHIDEPTGLTQDYRLDLIVGGVVRKNDGSSIGAMFRIHLLDALHQMENVQIDTIWKESAHPQRRFVGIGVLPDNQFLVSRTGPDNSSGIDPDSRIMKFSQQNEYITPISDLTTGTGTGINYINQLTQLVIYPGTKDFILLQRNIGVAYGALWMVFVQGEFEGYQPKFNPTIPKDAGVDFIRPNRFIAPGGVAIDNKRLDIFIIDAAQDSVFKFNSRGAFKSASFGIYRTNHRMQSPTGAAFFDKTLFVADSSANCIFRFKLSSDF
jgi:hypothetical protein